MPVHRFIPHIAPHAIAPAVEPGAADSVFAESVFAEGRFAAGHLGELTRLVPFEMVDAALAETHGLQQRLRDLPSRVVVYLLLAAALFPEIGYLGVWRKLTAGMAAGCAGPVPRPSASGLAQARRRVGPEPLRWLFDLLRGPASAPRLGGVWWRGLLVCAIDGTVLTVPDQPAVLTRYTKQGGNHGGTGYPQLRLLTLVACGTRAVIDAVFGPTTIGETTCAPRLAGSLKAGMLVLADRNFAAAGLLTHLAATGAEVLVRCKNGRRLPVLARYPDGSYLSVMGTLRVRVIAAEITVTTPAGQRASLYRLVTTLLDPKQCPAADIVALYHQRWEIETSYLELKSTMLGGRVLRARTPAGIEQEVYALLVAYQLLRTAITDAILADQGPHDGPHDGLDDGLDPDRASFTIAWQTARDQIIQATAATTAITATVTDLIGTIGAHVLANPLPPRRTRVSPRIVKRAISKYQARGPHPDRTSHTAILHINIHTGEST